MTRARRIRIGIALVVVATATALLIALIAADTSPTERTLPTLSTSYVAKRGAFTWPASMAKFRATWVSNTELNATFTMNSDELASFLKDSVLDEPTDGSVIHASPLWKNDKSNDSDTSVTVTHTQSVRKGKLRVVEVVRRASTPDRLTIRLAVLPPTE